MSGSGPTDHNHRATVARIRELAVTVRDPNNAGEIFDAAGVARKAAETYLRHPNADSSATTRWPGPEPDDPDLSAKQAGAAVVVRCLDGRHPEVADTMFRANATWGGW